MYRRRSPHSAPCPILGAERERILTERISLWKPRLAHRPCGRFFEKVTLPPWTGTSSIHVWPAGTSSF